MLFFIYVRKIVAYATTVGLFLSFFVGLWRLQQFLKKDFFLLICDIKDNPMLDIVIFVNGKPRIPIQRKKYRGMIICKLSDIGKIVSVLDKTSRKHLGSFRLARKPGETVVKYNLRF